MFQWRSQSVLPQGLWPQKMFQTGGLEVDILVVRTVIESRIKVNTVTRKARKGNPESISK
jgi:hypothetical protein